MARRSPDLPLRSQLVGPFLRHVRAAGGDADALARACGLDASAEHAAEVLLPLEALQRFFDAAAAAARDPLLGVHVATALPRGAWAVVEYACRSSPTLREALVRLARYSALFNDLVVFAFDDRGAQGGVFEHYIPGRPLCLGRHGNEFWLAWVLDQARQVCGASVAPTRAWLAHPRPAEAAELARVLGTRDVAFGAERNGLALDRATLDRAIASHEAPLLSLLDAVAAQGLAAAAPAASSPATPRAALLNRVRASLREQLRSGAPTVEATARALRTGRRTLQRQLAAAGTSFHQLLEALRRELALQYLAEPKLAVGEVAYLLGYAELTAFLRAFRRWTGATPQQYRARQARERAAPR